MDDLDYDCFLDSAVLFTGILLLLFVAGILTGTGIGIASTSTQTGYSANVIILIVSGVILFAISGMIHLSRFEKIKAREQKKEF